MFNKKNGSQKNVTFYVVTVCPCSFAPPQKKVIFKCISSRLSRPPAPAWPPAPNYPPAPPAHHIARPSIRPHAYLPARPPALFAASLTRLLRPRSTLSARPFRPRAACMVHALLEIKLGILARKNKNISQTRRMFADTLLVPQKQRSISYSIRVK